MHAQAVIADRGHLNPAKSCAESRPSGRPPVHLQLSMTSVRFVDPHNSQVLLFSGTLMQSCIHVGSPEPPWCDGRQATTKARPCCPCSWRHVRQQDILVSRTPGVTLAGDALGVTFSVLTVMLAVRFIMSVFPAAERQKDEPPWAALVSLTDLMLRPVRQLLQQVRGLTPWQRGLNDSVFVEADQRVGLGRQTCYLSGRRCREGGKTQAGGYRRLLGCLLNHAWATPRRHNFNFNFRTTAI